MGSLTERLHTKLLTIDILNEGGSAPMQDTVTLPLSELREVVSTLADFDELRSRVREMERIKAEWEKANAEATAFGNRILQSYD